MAIAEVPGYGTITQSNAKDIYVAWRKGEVELTVSQQKRVESLVPPEERDQIEYETGNQGAKKEGADKIDTKGADAHNDKQAANATVTSLGGAIFAAAACVLGKLAANLSKEDGWIAFAYGLAASICGVGAVICANKFDNAYKDRTAASDAKDETNATLDGTSSALMDDMDTMNGDMEDYQALSEEYTCNVNTNTSMMADLQVQLADAQAAGDTAGVESIKAQMKSLEETDFSGEEEGLQEVKDKLEEYSSNNAFAEGVAGSGQTVSDFLKPGTALGAVATVNALLLGIATAFMGISVGMSALGSAKSASHFDFLGCAQGVIGAVLFGVAAGLLGTAGGIMGNKASKEFECGTNGDEMQEHVNTLNDMRQQQADYIGTTSDSFGETDQESEDSQEEAQDAAGKAVKDNTGNGSGPKKTEEEKDPQPA